MSSEVTQAERAGETIIHVCAGSQYHREDRLSQHASVHQTSLFVSPLQLYTIASCAFQIRLCFDMWSVFCIICGASAWSRHHSIYDLLWTTITAASASSAHILVLIAVCYHPTKSEPRWDSCLLWHFCILLGNGVHA